ncbi:hypothetical protein H2248_007741 [Termitomyces sp. 'cryptogamus']|nr:hypothetical protein H2248_007741 [Termitomyces sp. 'cryptogamus']
MACCLRHPDAIPKPRAHRLPDPASRLHAPKRALRPKPVNPDIVDHKQPPRRNQPHQHRVACGYNIQY